jgi:pimeloyl-[acyl-carrier protein] methyl ester esterase
VTALHYEMQGRGRDLVLLHGWSSNLGIWQELAARLARRFRVIAIDLPGHGGSDWDARAASPAAQAWRVHETLTPLTSRYALLGWSLGGQLALDLAAAMPAGIVRLALVSTTAKFAAAKGWRCGTAPGLIDRLAGRLLLEPERAIDEFQHLQVRGLAPRTARLALGKLRAALVRHGAPLPNALSSGLERLRQGDLRSSLRLVAAPALVIAGERDMVVRPAASRALAQALPQGRYIEMRGATHVPFLSHARQFAEMLTGFLRG